MGTPLEMAADQYLVRRGNARTIIAGYPWFTDWGRDTFIALRGLCLATGRLDVAEEILCSWAGTVSEGMLPNRFPDHGQLPEYNSVDASLWYVVAVGEFVEECQRQGYSLSTQTRATLKEAISRILNGYRSGTRYNIRMDQDGLIAAGVPGVQLTWMDAKVGDWVVTPRIGKPVEIQALWINALAVGYDLIADGETLYERAMDSFRKKFWNKDRNCLFDVIDCDHQPGMMDSFDPAQPDFRRGRASAKSFGRRPSQTGGGDRGTASLHALGSAVAFAGGCPLSRQIHRRRLGPGWSLSSRHGLGLADWAIRRGLGQCPRQHAGRPQKCPAKIPETPRLRICKRRG